MPVICQINIKEISGTIDVGKYIFSDASMDDMPIRVSISIKDTITINASVVGAIIYCFARQNTSEAVRVSASNINVLSEILFTIFDKISIYSDAKAQKHMTFFVDENKLFVSSHGNEHVVLGASTDGIYIATNTSEMLVCTNSILLPEAMNIDIGMEANAVLSAVIKLMPHIISVDGKAAASIKSNFNEVHQNIKVSTSQINALVGLFTTVEDCSGYTIGSLSSVTASDLYFIIL